MTAVLTPMHDDLRPNIELLARHCSALLSAGCSGLLLLGTTGEANSFTLRERRALLEAALAAGLPNDKLIVGTGCCALGDTIELTKHALSQGIARVLVLPPFYYKDVTDDGLFDAFATVIEEVADDRLRVLLYLIPQLTGIEMGVDLVTRLAKAFPGTVAGLKDSSGDWESTGALCRALGDTIDIMVGTEALLLQAMSAGASGCITAMGNLAAREIVELYEKRDTPEATARSGAINELRLALQTLPVIPALKAHLAQTTGDGSWRNVRPPLARINATE
ncbi:MAG: dihydrodipicolinate synthase family protein [Candidatus Eremiobacteraeota bacterium]|nr:dihydrodipicolinate synthase family protein [Candidatus Eremiobacteraeota bacterium]MBV8339536.1 dihydrodipicolinate synthase family protein [Candidatus Eremiobacteraeota bacterium]